MWGHKTNIVIVPDALVQHCVHRCRIAPAPPAAPRIVIMIAPVLLPMPHPRRIMEHGHIPIRVMGNIRVVAVHLRGQHVQVVLRGHAPAPAPVAAVHVH